MPQIVIDTSVFISALLSKKGAAYKLFLLLDSGLFRVNLSVPLVFEYESTAKRILDKTQISMQDLEHILDYICTVSNKKKIFFLWRTVLPDPGDDMVLELAVASGCDYIISFNQKHFIGCEQFGIETVTPCEFLERIGRLQ